ncbi:MAG: hypothetical protein Ct9H300mP19_08470 [Dehalococcoidia bacterium]|nr:MAG: hypothetical protein Ct9H300mP19_08470 [Dehalococcoidia bacterium]
MGLGSRYRHCADVIWGAGSRFSFGIFLKPVTEEFDWTRGSLAGAIAIAGLATGGLRPVAGMLADRYDPKTVAATGVAIGGLALLECLQYRNFGMLMLYS